MAGVLLWRPPRFPGVGIVARSTGVAVNVTVAPLLALALMGTTVAVGLVVVDAFRGMAGTLSLAVCQIHGFR